MAQKTDPAIETYSPDKIFVKGDSLQKKIYERTQQIERHRVTLLNSVTEALREACGPDDDPVEKAAGLLIVLEEGYNLSAEARRIQAYLQRAAELQREHRDLSRFGRTLMNTAIYELTWEEADRFGI